MFVEVIRNLLHPITELLYLLIKETRMNQAETIDALNAANDKLADVDTKIVALTDTVDKVGTETTALLAEIQTLNDEVLAAHTTSPALLAAIDAISTRATTIAGHVSTATAAAAAVDAAVPDKAPALVVPPVTPLTPVEPAPVVPPVTPLTPVEPAPVVPPVTPPTKPTPPVTPPTAPI